MIIFACQKKEKKKQKKKYYIDTNTRKITPQNQPHFIFNSTTPTVHTTLFINFLFSPKTSNFVPQRENNNYWSMETETSS